MRWLRMLPNENIKLLLMELIYTKKILSIMGQGGMGKATLLQHILRCGFVFPTTSICKEKKRVITDMLKSLDKKRPDLDSLDALQDRLKIVVGSKKFLLILDDIREEENRDISKREDVLALVACGKFGNRILVTTRMDLLTPTTQTTCKRMKKTNKLVRELVRCLT
ncbi:hypothetical protein IEQ34_021610 [Dendrobium chrysotoxum]|uniref:NB-ARC domain-containing protein n=1 Tax=Dendrobium chrysotoxum TaxID=161865 RepID=A0AAV7G6B3_DENCH|nr:hypothetical protein IEQ34_021610 [Dendrobium chrysotoxum]